MIYKPMAVIVYCLNLVSKFTPVLVDPGTDTKILVDVATGTGRCGYQVRPSDPTTRVIRGARRDMCTRKTRALQHCRSDRICVCTLFQKVPDDIEILMQSATVDFALCSGPRYVWHVYLTHSV